MRRLVTGSFVMILAVSSLQASTVREVRTRSVAPSATLPIDLTAPEGKSRWQLGSIPLGSSTTIGISWNVPLLVKR